MCLARVVGCAVLLLLYGSTAADPTTPGDVVRNFVSAFDRHDLPALIALAHPDIEWLSVDGPEVHLEAKGTDALEASIAAHLESCSSCRSVVEVSSVNGQYVSAVETATWSVSGKTRSQASTSIYQVVNGQVRRVWYFPAVKPE